MKIQINMIRELECADHLLISIASAGSLEAKKKGLHHAGFGMYKDKSGKVTHRVVEGKLVAVKEGGAKTKSAKPAKPASKPKAGGSTATSFYGKHADVDRAVIKKHKDKIINATAAAGHEQWKADYKKSNGADATRLKKTKDTAWIEKHGADEVDIANTKYDDLPDDWKKENQESAKSAVEGLLKAKGKGASGADAAASHVHDKWLERNGSWAPENQKLPFDKLSKDEQDKDRFFVKQALKHAAKHS